MKYIYLHDHWDLIVRQHARRELGATVGFAFVAVVRREDRNGRGASPGALEHVWHEPGLRSVVEGCDGGIETRSSTASLY